MKAEANAVWELHAAGMLRSIHYRQDMRGVVAIFEAADLADVVRAVDELPMVRAAVVVPEVIPLKPFTGYERLFAVQDS